MSQSDVGGMRDELLRLEAENTRLRAQAARVEGLERELSTLASVYVASFQLGGSLRRELALRHVGELLTQLIGVRDYGVYLLDEQTSRLSCVAGEGLTAAQMTDIPMGAGAPDVWGSSLERSCRKAVELIADDPRTRREGEPIACIPLRLDDRSVGVVAITSLLPQKAGFVDVDRELFKLLTAHCAAAIFAAELYESAGRVLPAPHPTGSLR